MSRCYLKDKWWERSWPIISPPSGGTQLARAATNEKNKRTKRACIDCGLLTQTTTKAAKRKRKKRTDWTRSSANSSFKYKKLIGWRSTCTCAVKAAGRAKATSLRASYQKSTNPTQKGPGCSARPLLASLGELKFRKPPPPPNESPFASLVSERALY